MPDAKTSEIPEGRELDLFDLRVVERNIEKGIVTREQYEAYLASLEDVSSNAVTTTTRMVAHED